MSVTSDLIRITEMKIYYLLSILIILLAVSTSQQRSIADGVRGHTEEAGAGATPWSVEHRHPGHRLMSPETAEAESIAEATPWP